MANTLPTGTVTFLFTDIQASTPLWEQNPADMQAAVAQHHAILRQAIEANGGHITQIIGDSFQSAFRLASDALCAAIEAQRALQAAIWPELVGGIKVRMGIHTGHAEIDPHGDAPYAVSHTLNRVARVMSSGYGGQILLSQEAASLIAPEVISGRGLLAGVSLQDLGFHRLKGLSQAEHLYQVLVPGLPHVFPPLASGWTHPHNLPVQLTSFIGREKEAGEITELLRQHRLVTLTGSGGTGKTRLAVHVGGQMLDSFPEGVWFVELAPLTDPDLVPRITAITLGLQESGVQDMTTPLVNFLRNRRLLLIFDNCEHLIESVARLSNTLLRACPQIKIMASSREALGVAGEMSYRVPSLPVPDPRKLPQLEMLAQITSVQLFAERAAASQPGFVITDANAHSIAQICQRLDGIPLAIELAAARVGWLGVETIASRLDQRFRLLTGGVRTALPRQQTLRASIDWSFSLLSMKERLLLTRLSVFAGGWPLKAAESICGFGDLDSYDVVESLAQLVNKSLVIFDETDNSVDARYHMLETIRQYAREKLLDAQAGEVVRNRHLEYFAQLAEENDQHLRGPNQVELLDALEADLDNFRAAIEWSMEADPVVGLRLASALFWLWHIRGYRVEGVRYMDQLAEVVSARTAPSHPRDLALGRAMARIATLNFWMSSVSQRTMDLANQSRSLLESLNPPNKDSLILALFVQTLAAYVNNEKQKFHLLGEQMIALAEETGNRFMACEAYNALLIAIPDNLVEGLALAEKALSLRFEIGDLDGISTGLSIRARFYYAMGNISKAILDVEESLRYAERLKNRFSICSCLFVLGWLHTMDNDVQGGIDFLRRTLALTRDIGEDVYSALALVCLAYAAWRQGDPAIVQSYINETEEAARLVQFPDIETYVLNSLGDLSNTMGNKQDAIRFYLGASASAEKMDAPLVAGMYGKGKVHWLNGKEDEATSCFLAGLESAARQSNNIDMSQFLEALAGLYAGDPGLTQHAVRLFGAIDVLREKFPLYLWRVEKFYKPSDREVFSAPARVLLGESRYNALYQEGRQMTLEEAIECARGNLD